MSYCEDTLKDVRELKIDEAEVMYLKKRIITIRITDSEIAEVKEIDLQESSARLIQDKKIFGVKTSDIDKITQRIQNSLATTKYLKPKEFWRSLPKSLPKINKIEKTFDSKLDSMSGVEATDIAQTMINEATSPKITSISGSLNIVSDTYQLANTNGLSFEDNSTYISGVVNTDCKQESITVSGIGQECCRTLDAFDAVRVGKDSKSMCLDSVNPVKVESDDYSIIFEPYSVGEILAFVFASNFNFKTFKEQKSCFSDQKDKKIASDILTITDDPFVPNAIGSKSVDDEGIITKKLSLIEKGIFKDTYSDLFESHKHDSEPTGNASRPGSPMGKSAEPNTIASPHNLRVVGNTSKKKDMVKDIRKGIVVGRLWYTYAVNPIQGDFSCTARSGIQVIENGEIKNPGKPVRIIHNLKKLLQNTVNIADDAKNVQQWDSLPSISPSIQFDNIRVNSI